jgi:hypothetical protein
VGRVCYGYKLSPDAVLDMPYTAFLCLANNLEKYREEEAAYMALALWGKGSDEESAEVVSYDSPEDLRRIFGGM